MIRTSTILIKVGVHNQPRRVTDGKLPNFCKQIEENIAYVVEILCDSTSEYVEY